MNPSSICSGFYVGFKQYGPSKSICYKDLFSKNKHDLVEDEKPATSPGFMNPSWPISTCLLCLVQPGLHLEALGLIFDRAIIIRFFHASVSPISTIQIKKISSWPEGSVGAGVPPIKKDKLISGAHYFIGE
ncbi:hypothetical protein Tco_0256980 [Tanacetum coccineum]